MLKGTEMNIPNIFKPITKPVTLRDYRLAIEDDIEDGLTIKILETNHDQLVVCDNTDSRYSDHIYRITNPSLISENWIKEKILVTPSTNDLEYKVDEDSIASYLYLYVKRNYMLTMENIVFCNDIATDWDYLHKISDKFAKETETNLLPAHENSVFWHDSGKIIINFGNIIRETEREIEAGQIAEWEKEDVVNEKLMVSLLYEIRNLAFSNPYIPDDIMEQRYANKNVDAKEYAADVYSNCKAYVITEREKELYTDIEAIEL